MYALTVTLLVLSASVLLVQGGSIPSSRSDEDSTAVDITNNGFSIKTGYEGYIASVDPQKSGKSDLLEQIDNFIKSDLITKLTFLKNGLFVLKKLLMPLAVKLIASVKFLSIVLLWGVVATSTVCKFTSLCSFSVNLPDIKKQEIQERIVNLARPYMSEESLDYTLKTVRSAFDQYNAVQEFV